MYIQNTAQEQKAPRPITGQGALPLQKFNIQVKYELLKIPSIVAVLLNKQQGKNVISTVDLGKHEVSICQ